MGSVTRDREIVGGFTGIRGDVRGDGTVGIVTDIGGDVRGDVRGNTGRRVRGGNTPRVSTNS
jgi:hypothetical protein